MTRFLLSKNSAATTVTHVKQYADLFTLAKRRGPDLDLALAVPHHNLLLRAFARRAAKVPEAGEGGLVVPRLTLLQLQPCGIREHVAGAVGRGPAFDLDIVSPVGGGRGREKRQPGD